MTAKTTLKKSLAVFLMAIVLVGGIVGCKPDTVKAWYTEPTTYVKSLNVSWGWGSVTVNSSNLPTTRLKIVNRGSGVVTVYYRSSSSSSYSKVGKLNANGYCYVSLCSTGQIKISKNTMSSTVLDFYR